MPSRFPTLLIILDGLGISDATEHNAFFQAHSPHLDTWKLQHSYTTLQASGKFVGLPYDYNGNSEVGHFALGSGRIINQTSTILNQSMEQNILRTNSILANELKDFNQKSRIHILLLASNGNIHSNIDHLHSLLFTLNFHKITNFVIHAFLDGRDTAPYSAEHFLNNIEADLQKYKCGKIASLHGRFYAMDRNKNFDRTQKSFDILTQQQSFTPYQQAIKDSYDKKISDEFFIPTACIKDHTIQPGDGVIFLNFRPDRAIQLTEKLLTLDLAFLITPIIYHPTLRTTPLIQAVQADNTLLEVLSKQDKTIFTIAETEKYAHVTYFFNGHKNITIPHETRTLIPSSTDADITQNPNMQAEIITECILNSLTSNPKDFYLANYANADMIGHSGNIKATITAIECLDSMLGKLYDEVVIQQNGIIYITADHGNAELMYDTKNNQVCTSHTNNPVPFYMVSQKNKQDLDLQSLACVAPFILKNMNLNIPNDMK